VPSRAVWVAQDDVKRPGVVLAVTRVLLAEK